MEVARDNPNFPWYRFDDVPMAQGYCRLGVARGALVMSNIFLSTGLIFLASKEAGCLNEEGDEVLDECDEKVYGFKPASFISNIAVISGVLSALLMPMAGAMIDYTSFRWLVGLGIAVAMIVIQAVQITISSSNWFIMAILQAIAGFFYQVEVLATYAYLPDIARQLGQSAMTRHSSLYTMCQFGSQFAFLVTVTALSIALGLDTVWTAKISQIVNVLWTGVIFALGWRLMPAVPARHELQIGKSLLTEGFFKIFRTAKEINQKYKKGVRWYFLALVFAEAAANSFTLVSVVYLDEHLGFSVSEIGIFFIVVILSTIPGARIGAVVTARTDPNVSWQLTIVTLLCYTVVGAIALDYVSSMFAFLWGVGIGMLLGAFYPAENLFFSMCLPAGQEAEMAGFFVYCTQILGWLPPLIFTMMVEADVSQTYGVITVSAFGLLAVAALRMTGTWEEILEEAGRTDSKSGVLVPPPARI